MIWWWWLMFYVHFCAHGRLNGLNQPPMVMKRSQRWNTPWICPRRDSISGGRDLWSNELLVTPWRCDEGRSTITVSLTSFVAVYDHSPPNLWHNKTLYNSWLSSLCLNKIWYFVKGKWVTAWSHLGFGPQ